MISPSCKNCTQFKNRRCTQYQIKIERPNDTTCLNFYPKNPFSIGKFILKAIALLFVFLFIGVFFV